MNVAFRRPKRERDDATFDLTPMIDVVLLLIIFFMLTSQFAAADRARVDLPVQKGFDAQSGKGAEIVIDVSKTGEPSLAGKVISVEGLLNELMISQQSVAAAAKGDTPGALSVLIRADAACPTPALQAICAVVNNAGIKVFALATSGEEGS